jgi:hypothetical protein
LRLRREVPKIVAQSFDGRPAARHRHTSVERTAFGRTTSRPKGGTAHFLVNLRLRRSYAKRRKIQGHITVLPQGGAFIFDEPASGKQLANS